MFHQMYLYLRVVYKSYCTKKYLTVLIFLLFYWIQPVSRFMCILFSVWNRESSFLSFIPTCYYNVNNKSCRSFKHLSYERQKSFSEGKNKTRAERKNFFFFLQPVHVLKPISFKIWMLPNNKKCNCMPH